MKNLFLLVLLVMVVLSAGCQKRHGFTLKGPDGRSLSVSTR